MERNVPERLLPSLCIEPTEQSQSHDCWVTGHRRHRVAHNSLPREKSTVYNLRPRVHNFELPWKDTLNFLARQLFTNIYCPKQS